MNQTFVSALQNPELFPHPVSGFELIETHISWVLLTGDFVYKIKKPVNFGFLDYSTLEQRAHFCKEELRLNQRLAPDLYLAVIPVYGSAESPSLKPDGQPIEYMVKTRQFRQQDLLGNLQRDGLLQNWHIDQLAERLAAFHADIQTVAADAPQGLPEQVHAPVTQNFEQIRQLINQPDQLSRLQTLENWANTTFDRLHAQLQQRRDSGFIRECHGDIYLDNVTLVDGQVTLFDCIEFNEDFRWIDTMSDVAFMVMDLRDRQLDRLANRFLNRYLEITGDYAGLAVLDYYIAYRAMVRAKVALLRLTQPIDEAGRLEVMQRYTGYISLAMACCTRNKPLGLIMHGVSGSGKSTLGLQLVEQLGCVRLRSDIERQRLFADHKESDRYSAQAGDAVYQLLGRLSQLVLDAGRNLLIDATHLQQRQRQLAREQITASSGIALILHCNAPLEQLEQRIQQRQQQGEDPSEADIDILHKQLAALQPLVSDEQAISLDANQPLVNLLQEIGKRRDAACVTSNSTEK